MYLWGQRYKIIRIFLAQSKLFVFLQHDNEAIHNKDYSVVKTSKTERPRLLRLFYAYNESAAALNQGDSSTPKGVAIRYPLLMLLQQAPSQNGMVVG